MSDKGWKAYERRIARLLGTQRVPVTGERCGADCETPVFAVQIKKRQTVPGYLVQWVSGIRQSRPSKVGIVVMQLPHQPDIESLVVMSLKDFLDLHGPTGTP